MIYGEREHDYNSNEIFYSEEQMAELDINLEAFYNSLNFIFGLTGGDVSEDSFDILNNPYVRFVGLERTVGRNFTEKYEFEICSEAHKERFIPEHALDWYN